MYRIGQRSLKSYTAVINRAREILRPGEEVVVKKNDNPWAILQKTLDHKIAKRPI